MSTCRHRSTLARRGAALLLVLFLVAVTTPLVCLLLESHASHLRCTRNGLEGTAARYAAEAGIERALAELRIDPAWRAGFDGEPVASGLRHRFSVRVVQCGDDSLEITATGRSARGVTKTVTAVIDRP